jgi:hypothetical protein
LQSILLFIPTQFNGPAIALGPLLLKEKLQEANAMLSICAT